MKKTLSVLLASAAIFGCFAFASCADRSENVKVFKELELTAEDYAFAVKKGNTDLLARVNRGLRTIKRNGEFAVIYKKWFGKEPPKALFE